MSQSGSMSQNRHAIARCPTCDKDMVVTRISPDGPGFELAHSKVRCVWERNGSGWRGSHLVGRHVKGLGTHVEKSGAP